MVRPPDKETPRLTWAPSSLEGKKKVRDFKALCIQDGISQNDLLEKAVDLIFKVSHWPPGNPQRTLESMTKPLVFVKCGCGKTAVKHGVHLASGVHRDFCVKCFGELPARHDLKVWRFN